MVNELPPKSKVLGCLGFAVGVILLLGLALGPVTNGVHHPLQSSALQTAHAIGLEMLAYADDHDGNFPDGKTSTEVFQKLVDGGYIEDPSIFYLPRIPGKTEATSKKLTADNVCFDVTSGVTKNSPDDLPVIFATGYTVTYLPGASATLDPNSVSPFHGDGTVVGYTSKDPPAGLSFAFRVGNLDNGTIAGFAPATFDPGHRAFRQLKP